MMSVTSCVDMSRVIEYEDGKKFIRDVKMGRRWRVTKRRKRKRKEGEKSNEWNPNPSGHPQRKRRGDSELALWPSRRSGGFRKPKTF